MGALEDDYSIASFSYTFVFWFYSTLWVTVLSFLWSVVSILGAIFADLDADNDLIF
jgi:hypothetical protein